MASQGIGTDEHGEFHVYGQFSAVDVSFSIQYTREMPVRKFTGQRYPNVVIPSIAGRWSEEGGTGVCGKFHISHQVQRTLTHLCTNTTTCMHTYIHTYIHTFTRTCIHTHMHGYIHKFIHTCTHTFIHTCIHTCMHTHARINNHSMPLADQPLDPGDRSPCPALTPPYVDWPDTDSIYAPHRRDPRGAMPRRTMRNV